MRTITPIWQDALPPGAAFPGGTQRVDVAVIGGGLTGMSAAYHLLQRRPGARVAVLEAVRVGEGASGRSTGMLSPGVGQSLTSLIRRLGPARAQALYRASLDAVGAVADLIERERIECELDLGGQLLVARSAASRARLRVLAEQLEALALPGRPLVDAGLARRLRLATTPPEPERGPAAMLLPIAGTLHPGRLLAGLQARVSERGGVVWEGARVRRIGAGRPVRLALDDGEVIADDVVLATAGHTAELGLLRGRVLPVHLQVLVTEPLDAIARDAIDWRGREGVLDARRIFGYGRLTADDRIVFGGGMPRYRWGGGLHDDAGGARALDRLARELAAMFPGAAQLRVAGGWTGLIDYVIDALPAIERARGHAGVVHALGWCGHGVALSVASGAWVTRILCDGAAPGDLPWFRDHPPLVPFEPLRWLGFHATTKIMRALDRFG
jgi:glycine/D-amino acid oxidase-like deaminating enzyme